MEYFCTALKNIILLFLSQLIVFSQVCQAQSDIRGNSFYYPHEIKKFQFSHTIGLSFANLPEDIVESDDAFRAPEIRFRSKFGLPAKFLLESAIKTNLITFNFALGPKWVYEFGKFTSSLGVETSYLQGTLYQLGFKSSFNGWNVYPNLTIGYVFPNFSISLKSDLLLVIDQSAKNGGLEVTSKYKTFSGCSFTLFLEQPLWKDNFFIIAFKSNYVSFFYPIWFTFSTFNRFFYIPELIISFNL